MRPARPARLQTSCLTFTLAAILSLGAAADLSAQIHETASHGTSTSRVASPTVVASWASHENDVNGSATTLLVLWRGTPGWFMKGEHSAGGTSQSSSGGESSFQYVTQGGLTFAIELDYQKKIAKILNQEIALTSTNVVLVDFVDGPNGPTIVGSRWVEPAPSGQAPAGDPIAAVVRRTPELFDYLRCDLSVPDPAMQAMLAMVCAQMRP